MAERFQRIAMVVGRRRVEFFAAVDETLEKSNLLPSVEVEQGYPITSMSRVLPRNGTLSIALIDDLVGEVPQQLVSRFIRLPNGTYKEEAQRVPIDKKAQKDAIDFILDLKRTRTLATYASELEAVPNVAIEGVKYSRRRGITNVIYADVRWKEILVARTATSTVQLMGKLDPSLEAGNTLIDAPVLDQGHVVLGAQHTTADATVTPATKKTRVSWRKLWGRR